MIFRFDLARLKRFQRESLQGILDVIQSENKLEIVIYPVELPYKFLVLADNTVELLEGFGDAVTISAAGVRGDRCLARTSLSSRHEGRFCRPEWTNYRHEGKCVTRKQPGRSSGLCP